jgi:hypothetical protein
MLARSNIFILLCFSLACNSQVNNSGLSISQPGGLRILVVQKDYPLLKILLPGQSISDRGIEVEFPEHITGVNEKNNQVEHLYLTTARNQNKRTLPVWHVESNVIRYETSFGQIEMTATAELEKDGVGFIYKLTNHSDTSFRNIQAVTCVKLYSVFSDTMLERTYVHHADGFDLLASETPARLTMPLQKWLPCRYLVSYTWPVPAKQIEKGSDSITRYYKSRKVDKPFIATFSHDKKWIAATYTKETGNLWTNPERSCQHADPAVNLKGGETKILELKTFIVRGNLEQVLEMVNTEMKK